MHAYFLNVVLFVVDIITFFWLMESLKNWFFSFLGQYFGPAFVHDASTTPIPPPQYVDPYALLEEERISTIAPRVN